jgi:cytochrome P450
METAQPTPLAAPQHAAAPRLQNLNDLPGPRRLPWIGNSLQLAPHRLHLVLEDWARRYGPLFVYHMGPKPVLVITDAELCQLVLRARPEGFRRMTQLARACEETVGPGVFSAEGEDWRRQRRLWIEALSNRHLKGFFPTLQQITKRLQRRWQALSASGGAVDIRRDLLCFTLDVTATLAFGFDVNTLDGRDAGLHRDLSEIFPAILRRALSPIPYWRWIELPRDRALNRGLRALRPRLLQEIARVRAQPTTDEPPQNFLEGLVTARDEDGKPYPDELLVGNAVTMLLAGEDTTANTLAWAIHHLCERPDWVDALRAEADEVLGASAVLDRLEQAESLKVALAIANETLRVSPVAPWLGFEALKDTVVGSLAVPRGTLVNMLLRPAVERAEGCPAPLEFNPQRWLDGPRAAHERIADIAFGSGSRLCPGRSLGLLELRVVLSMLVKNFDFERLGPASAVHEVHSFTMVPEGLSVRLLPRQPQA